MGNIFFVTLFVVSSFLASIGEYGSASTTAIAATRLNGALTAAAVTATVDNTTDFPQTDSLNPFVPPAYIQVGDEIMTYTHTYVAPGPDTTHFYGLTRGVNNPQNGVSTTAAAHADNDTVRSLSAQTLNNMFDVINVVTESGFGSFVSLVFTGRLFTAMWNTLTWNYSFLTGQLVWLKYFIFWPMSIGFIWAVAFGLVILAMSLFKAIP